jgi:hypothetical protein
MALVPCVLLSVTLAGPTPSGSASASRLCQGCSHPPRHLPGQAALSFAALLRQGRRCRSLTSTRIVSTSRRTWIQAKTDICEGCSEVPVQHSHPRAGAIGFPRRSAGVAARSGREAGGVKHLERGRWTAQGSC